MAPPPPSATSHKHSRASRPKLASRSPTPADTTSATVTRYVLVPRRDWYFADCHQCDMRMPFDNSFARDVWAKAHAGATGHLVTLDQEIR